VDAGFYGYFLWVFVGILNEYTSISLGAVAITPRTEQAPSLQYNAFTGPFREDWMWRKYLYQAGLVLLAKARWDITLEK